jgi:hypothetical protein
MRRLLGDWLLPICHPARVSAATSTAKSAALCYTRGGFIPTKHD